MMMMVQFTFHQAWQMGAFLYLFTPSPPVHAVSYGSYLKAFLYHYLVSYFWSAPTIALLSFFCFFILSASLCMVIIMLSIPVFWKSSWYRKMNAAQIAIKIKALLLEWKEEKPIGCADIYKVKKLWDIARLFEDNHTRQLFCRNIQNCVVAFLSKLQTF